MFSQVNIKKVRFLRNHILTCGMSIYFLIFNAYWIYIRMILDIYCPTQQIIWKQPLMTHYNIDNKNKVKNPLNNSKKDLTDIIIHVIMYFTF